MPRSLAQQETQLVDAAEANRWAIGLFVFTMALLLLPKLWSYIALLGDPQRLAECGGARRAAGSILFETIVSILVAPILMAFAAHWKQTALALLAALAIWLLAPAMFVWLIPVFAGLILAIPLSIFLSSVAFGRALARRGLLLIPQETVAPNVLVRHRHFLELAPSKELADTRGMFRRVLTDPAMLALHRCILEATEVGIAAGPRAIALARRQLLAGGPLRVSAENRKAILSDPAALEALHLFIWTTRVRQADC
jgi:membrane glycosyltransferase